MGEIDALINSIEQLGDNLSASNIEQILQGIIGDSFQDLVEQLDTQIDEFLNEILPELIGSDIQELIDESR